jgi:SpoIIAA-like
MITIEKNNNTVTATVLGEFALADFQEFEALVSDAKAPTGTKLSLLFDLRNMADFTVDVAWEEIKFSRAHGYDFGKIAVLSSSQWVAWSAWLTRAISDAEIDVFEDQAEAETWLAE